MTYPVQADSKRYRVFVPLPLWLLATSLLLAPFKVSVMVASDEQHPYKAFPELASYDSTLPVMRAMPWALVMHLILISLMIGIGLVHALDRLLCDLVLDDEHPYVPTRPVLLQHLHYLHCVWVILHCDKLSTSVPWWTAEIVNLSCVALLVYFMPGDWKSVTDPHVMSKGNATVYWTVFGLPWWLEMVAILYYVPLSLFVPLVFFLIWYMYLSRPASG